MKMIAITVPTVGSEGTLNQMIYELLLRNCVSIKFTDLPVAEMDVRTDVVYLCIPFAFITHESFDF